MYPHYFIVNDFSYFSSFFTVKAESQKKNAISARVKNRVSLDSHVGITVDSDF